MPNAATFTDRVVPAQPLTVEGTLRLCASTLGALGNLCAGGTPPHDLPRRLRSVQRTLVECADRVGVRPGAAP